MFQCDNSIDTFTITCYQSADSDAAATNSAARARKEAVKSARRKSVTAEPNMFIGPIGASGPIGGACCQYS